MYFQTNLLWQKGWPLTLSNGALSLHLGKIDESLVRNQDIYICIQSLTSNVTPTLFACWRTTSVNETAITFRKLDPHKDPITPLYIEMLAGEELPHLLQTLLVGVEHAICRIPLDELTFPLCPQKHKSQQNNHQQQQQQHNTDDVNDNTRENYLIDDKSTVINGYKRVECNLKRRELITKNNSINKKYAAIKKIACNGQCDENESETTLESENVLCCSSGGNIDESIDKYYSIANDVSNGKNEQVLTSGVIASTLPLFCLGGSFPHIDSDEESGDDAKNTKSGEFLF